MRSSAAAIALRTATLARSCDELNRRRRPARPVAAPTWSSSEKDAVGTSHFSSRVWFTVGHGILNEIYWPRVDRPQVRDLGFIVADDNGFWSEVKRDATREVRSLEPGVPAIITTETFERAGQRLAGVEAVVVGLGPGPFTGLRVGIATAAALGDALDLRLDAELTGGAGVLSQFERDERARRLLPHQVIDARRELGHGDVL